MNTITHARVHVTHGVGVDAVRESVVAVRENLPVVQPLAVCGDVVTVDGGGEGGVVFAREAVHARVRDVDVFEVRGKFDAVGRGEAIGHGLDDAGVGLKAICLETDRRDWTEVLPPTVRNIGKPKISSDGMLFNIVDRSEVAAKEVV